MCEENPGTFPYFFCSCRPGYYGTYCEKYSPTTPKPIISDPCVPNPCQNNGFCYHYENSYKCRCQPGCFGPVCQITSQTFSNLLTVSSCEPNPCLNGAKSQEYFNAQPQPQMPGHIQQPLSVLGACTAGYTGKFCELSLQSQCADRDEKFCNIIKINGYCSNDLYIDACQASCGRC